MFVINIRGFENILYTQIFKDITENIKLTFTQAGTNNM